MGLSLFSISSQAAVLTVTVQDFSFSPASITVNVGDTIQWTWVSGSHTTTSGTIPDGALPWDQAINSTSVGFSYVVTVTGDYAYNCTIHPTQMIANFTAVATTGISPIVSSPVIDVSNSLLSNEVQVNYSLTSPANVTIGLYNIMGVRVKNFISAFHPSGDYSETFAVGTLPKGMYFLSLQTPDGIVTRKVVIQ